MPYIGQSPATGEANSFKTLDNIASYTLTLMGRVLALYQLLMIRLLSEIIVL